MATRRPALACEWLRAIILCLLPTLGVAAELEPPPPVRPYLLLDVMHQFQRYADKLHFSGRSDNWELAGWYLWKLESAAILVIEGRVETYRTDRFDARPLMEAMLIPAIREVGKAIEGRDADGFRRSYGALVQTCNACHAATEHAFVRVVVPVTPIYTNQDYTRATAEPPPTALDGVRLLGPPPSPGSAAYAADAAGVRESWSGARIAQARIDTAFDAFLAFAPVLGSNFTADAYPATRRAFERVAQAMEAPLNGVKAHWSRARPFVIDRALATCIPVDDKLASNGSYPSGHATAGWAWALLLTELLPARANALLERGREFGESRVVCGLHWPSDNTASQVLGAAIAAQLRADESFRDLLGEARRELTPLNTSPMPPEAVTR